MNIIAIILVICSSIEWNIKDSTKRQYVLPNELSTLISHTNLNPEGKPTEEVMTQAIENCVQSHPMVRHAECYITTRGVVKVVLTQRVPLLGVKTEDKLYYIDEDRLRMPIHPRVNADELIWAKGKLDEAMAQTVLSDIVVWLKKHSYWENRITGIDVKNKLDIVLIDSSGLRVRIGDGTQLENKMHKWRVFEEQMRKVEGKTYKELDLRYQDQVIGRE